MTLVRNEDVVRLKILGVPRNNSTSAPWVTPGSTTA